MRWVPIFFLLFFVPSSNALLIHESERLEASLDAEGLTFRSLDRKWSIRMDLDGPDATASRRDGSWIRADRGRIQERVESKPEGLEHTFLIQEGETSLSMQVKSRGIDQVSMRNGDIVFRTADRVAMTYGGLKVYDATGRRLKSRMTWTENRIDLVVLEIGEYPILVDPLAATPDWTAEGNQAGGWFGYASNSAGDVNGDGYDDLIVSSPLVGNGIVQIFYGSATGLSATAGWISISGQANSSYGYSVDGAGDVNGDGYDDVIIGSPDWNVGGTSQGRVFVYHGSPTGPGTTANWTADGIVDYHFLGWSVSSAGDVNGDGYDDVMAGEGRYASQAHVWLGSSSGLDTVAAWNRSEDNGSRYSQTLDGAGDINGDGFDDIIVGAWLFDGAAGIESGGMYAYYGSAAGPAATPSWTYEGPTVVDWVGEDIAGAGDVNNDGFDDVIMSAGGWNTGAAFVFLGSAGGLPGTYDFALNAEPGGVDQQVQVIGTGDVNNDGFDDVAVASTNYSNGQSQEGIVRVYYGGATMTWDPDWSRESDQAGIWYGYALASGDFNGDGGGDLAISAPQFTNGQADEGEVSVHYGDLVPGAGTTTGGTTTTGGGGGGGNSHGDSSSGGCSASSGVTPLVLPFFLVLLLALLLRPKRMDG